MTELTLDMEFAVPVQVEAPKTDLIGEIARGNREAMHSVFVLHQRRVYSIALNFFGGDASKAEDVTQQVFLKLFTKMSFRGDAEFTTWLYRMTVNACIDETRRARRFLGIVDRFSGNGGRPSDSPDELLHSREISEEVRAVVGRLKPVFRMPLILKYVEGLSYQEIAEVLNCSVGTVSSRISRGQKMLAERLVHLRGELK